jgi:hypothetical protein
MAEHQGEGGAIVAALRAAGLVLSLDAEGDIDLGGRPKAMAVWHAMAAAIEDLPKLVAEAMREEAGASDGAAKRDMEGDATPPDPALARWESIGSEAPAPPSAESSAPGRVKLPPAPQYEGIAVMCPRGQAWVARRNAARSQGRKFHGRPPYDMGRSDTATSHDIMGCSRRS